MEAGIEATAVGIDAAVADPHEELFLRPYYLVLNYK
uniref:Uncharacterized protein n=1 Tax=Oryza sativa subsp. japonica TaxID=39947 RepID=Q10K04_ORYSJ|nr:hypothetical protein LOC_Os03g28364 [Oryza sativa Japonica Group]